MKDELNAGYDSDSVNQVVTKSQSTINFSLYNLYLKLGEPAIVLGSDLIHITGESSRRGSAPRDIKVNLDAWNNSNKEEENELRSEDANHTLVSVMMSLT